MSKLKRCPFCGIGMETTNNKYYFHPNNNCILHDFGIDIENRRSVKAWNTRKPMEIIVERLEALRTCSDFGTCNHCQNRWCSMELLEADNAIKIVKEEGE